MGARLGNDPRRACVQQLGSDLLLGARFLPIDRQKVPQAAVPAAGPMPNQAGTEQAAALGPEEKARALQALAEEAKSCVKCPLSEGRTNVVFGQGNPDARLVFVGEAPGYHEDQQGLPFVGRAGKLLDDILVKGMGIKRADVYICNILKCRPPQNRDPGPDEIACCLPYLQRQLEIIAPQVICCLGRIAAQCLLETKKPMKELRGHWHEYRGVKTMVTYHTAYLLRNPADKKKSWMDIQKVMAELGLQRPQRR